MRRPASTWTRIGFGVGSALIALGGWQQARELYDQENLPWSFAWDISSTVVAMFALLMLVLWSRDD